MEKMYNTTPEKPSKIGIISPIVCVGLAVYSIGNPINFLISCGLGVGILGMYISECRKYNKFVKKQNKAAASGLEKVLE